MRVHKKIKTAISDRQGFFWAEKAAELGSLCGMYTQGLMLFNGIGALADYQKGIELITVAARGGEFASREFLLKLGYELPFTREQRKKNNRLN